MGRRTTKKLSLGELFSLSHLFCLLFFSITHSKRDSGGFSLPPSPDWRDLASNCLEQDFCASEPCKNGGICTQGSMWDYRCKCSVQFTGLHCELRRPPCELYNPCSNGGTCLNAGPTRTRCACPRGWAGTTCSEDRDECLELPCRNNGLCRNLGPGRGFECDCLGTGFQGARCEEDENECQTGNPCRNNGTCQNRAGGFR